eukprot:CAMPEP_0173382068 /NCGR_PEP_ID=MMETSP1356-20130122/4539_1 /TAXON_ID=77927 ORGANISM="Hemiselmis virescens, Strain PCC157" /NCGR_SAMPLE_ID=MMETSP1356 /ASSEMBLY_ACC=CAM_ASM_000847 /LENGTH=220 /DNA_ID=CAMNT_0014336231 /DNA_START=119 /DNA_END=781 /DNA_ORIENTATION=+
MCHQKTDTSSSSPSTASAPLLHDTSTPVDLPKGKQPLLPCGPPPELAAPPDHYVASPVVEERGDEEEEISEQAVVKGATASGGIFGLVLGGPFFGMITAGGAYYAVTRPGKVGEAARGVGRSSVLSFRSAKQYCKKNEVGPKLKRAGSRMVQGAKNFNRKHDVSGKVSRGFLSGLNKLSGDDKKDSNSKVSRVDKSDTPAPATPAHPASANASTHHPTTV